MKLALVALLLLADVARAGDCVPVDDPACMTSKACCETKFCGEDWRLTWIKRDPCPVGWGVRTSPPDAPGCGKMLKWEHAETKILAGYLDQKVLIAELVKGSSISDYQTAVAKASGAALTSGEASDVMSTSADCKINNAVPGCNWLLEQGLPPVACKLAEMHEGVHVQQCLSSGPAKSVLDASIREVIAHIKLLRAIRAWLDAECPSADR